MMIAESARVHIRRRKGMNGGKLIGIGIGGMDGITKRLRD